MENQRNQMDRQNFLNSSQQRSIELSSSLKREERELSLLDYLYVLNNRKKNIFVVFLLVVIMAVVVNLRMPNIFEAESLISVGRFRGEAIEKVTDIQKIFSSDLYLQLIISKLSLAKEMTSRQVASMFTIEVVKESKFLAVRGQGSSPELAIELVEAIAETLIERHDLLFKAANDTLEIEVETIKKNKQKIENDIKQRQEVISRLEKDVIFYQHEIEIRANVSSYAQGRLIEAYANLLAKVKDEKDINLLAISNLKQELVNLDQAIQQKQYEGAYETRPTIVEVPALVPEVKMGPHRAKNVMVAAVFGLLLGIFWAFGAEYQKKIISKEVSQV